MQKRIGNTGTHVNNQAGFFGIALFCAPCGSDSVMSQRMGGVIGDGKGQLAFFV